MSSVGQDINAKDGLWSFGNKVPKNFDDHVTNQVPYYLRVTIYYWIFYLSF